MGKAVSVITVFQLLIQITMAALVPATLIILDETLFDISPWIYKVVPVGNTWMFNDRNKFKDLYYALRGTETALSTRRETTRPYVEVGPGYFKSEIITYPENHQILEYKKLLLLKKKMEERKG